MLVCVMRIGRRRTTAVILPILAAVTWGCPGCTRSQATPVEQLNQGLVWMFPGVEGGPRSLQQVCRAFRNAGVTSAFRIHQWGRPLGIITNLLSYEGNRAAAARIAKHLVAYRETHLEAPIDLLGYSGGGGMAVMVAEALPEDVRLRNVILVQPALSPDYDLEPALKRVDGKLVNFYSPHDWLFLHVGTRVFGTMDRVHVASAGKDGFNVLMAVDEPELLERFEQHCWSPRMAFSGHVGTHLGILLYTWNKKYVAPYLLPPQDAPDEPQDKPVEPRDRNGMSPAEEPLPAEWPPEESPYDSVEPQDQDETRGDEDSTAGEPPSGPLPTPSPTEENDGG